MPYIVPPAEPLPVESVPPLREWTIFNLPWSGEVTELTHINMPNLYELQCNSSPLTTLPWDDLQNLGCLGVSACNFVALELWRMSGLDSANVSDCYDLEAIDAHGLTELLSLDVYYCPAITSLNVSGCPSFQYLYAYESGFDQAMVDQLLADLVGNGATDGYVQIDGGNEQPSDPDGLALMTILLSRGWSIYIT